MSHRCRWGDQGETAESCEIHCPIGKEGVAAYISSGEMAVNPEQGVHNEYRSIGTAFRWKLHPDQSSPLSNPQPEMALVHRLCGCKPRSSLVHGLLSLGESPEEPWI